jgi:UDP-N-acetylglucosamine--N-acetylmuramyl-(pentapeptide) pyrophosphoryl-undecaprenol N-acetylglucosamine transferase
VTIILTGGGSGGHITPLMAVAAELKRLSPKTRLVYIGQKGDSLADIPAKDPNIDAVYLVRAGKFRRYHGEGLRQLLDLPTLLKNIRDFFYVVAGSWQSWRLLGELKPDVMFSRGGFVSVPVGLGSALRHIPYITHDSDPVPSLANRLIARWAKLHAVALPKETYAYPPDKTVTTGIPMSRHFVPVTPKLREEYRKQIKIPATAKLLFIIGGGLGSRRVNTAVGEAIPHLLHEFNDLYVVHGAGRANQADMEKLYNQNLTPGEQGRVRVFGYLANVYRYSGAADLVITRAGATNLAEFAVQGSRPQPACQAGQRLSTRPGAPASPGQPIGCLGQTARRRRHRQADPRAGRVGYYEVETVQVFPNPPPGPPFRQRNPGQLRLPLQPARARNEPRPLASRPDPGIG